MMVNEITEKEIMDIVSKVKHPAINSSLVDLGIVKSVSVEGGKAKIIFAFPFANIPIGDQMINSVVTALAEHDIEMDADTVIMTQEERNQFLALETQNWSGGV